MVEQLWPREVTWFGNGPPVDGETGLTRIAKGCIYVDIDSGLAYSNKGSPAAPVFAAIGSGSGSGLRLIDLGVVNAVDLLDGAQTLYTPSEGQYIRIIARTTPITPFNNQPGSVSQGPTLTAPYGLYTDSLFDFVTNAVGVSTPAPWYGNYVAGSTEPLVANLVTALSSLGVVAALAAWQANHAYGAKALILGADDHIWSADDDGGTSAGSIPDFAGNEGATVADNDITWTDEGAIPTQGSIHLYALVS